jgi:hypothetical protein
MESLVNTELEGILKVGIVDQFKVNTWRKRERQRKLVKTASLKQERYRLDRAVSTCFLWTNRYQDTYGEERWTGTGQRQRQFRSLAPIKVEPPWWYYWRHKRISVSDMANCHIYPLNFERKGMSLTLPKSMSAFSDQCTENSRIRTF